MKYVTRIGIALAVIATGGVASQKPEITHARSTKPKTGVVSGRIFAVTQGGDLKPARMASVIAMISGAYSDEWLSSIEKDINGLKEAHIRQGVPWGDANTCKEELDAYDSAISRLLEGTNADVDAKRGRYVTRADEDGNFEVSLPGGSYILLARGRAGFNEAVWVVGPVAVENEKTSRYKMSAPEKSCFGSGADQ